MAYHPRATQQLSDAIRCWWRRDSMKMCEARYKDLQFWGKPPKLIEGHRPNQLEQLESFHLPSSTKSKHGKIMASLLEQWLLNLGDRPPQTVRIILKLIINQPSFISYIYIYISLISYPHISPIFWYCWWLKALLSDYHQPNGVNSHCPLESEELVFFQQQIGRFPDRSLCPLPAQQGS